MKRKLVFAILIFFLLYIQPADSYQQQPAPKKPAPATAPAQAPAGAGPNGSIIVPSAANPNLAPQGEVDAALYSVEEFFGTNARALRPFEKARPLLNDLIAKYPQDARLHLYAATLDERLERFDSARTEMEKYATLKSNSAAALRKLAIFYHNRALYKPQIETLQKLARISRAEDREIIYREILGIVREHALKEYSPSQFYKEMIAADPANIQLVSAYIDELKGKKRYAEALEAINTYQPKHPGQLQYFLKARAALEEVQGNRDKAEAVYNGAYDPLWPRAILSDYYDLLRNYGRYRIYRRALQKSWSASADYATMGRLFNLYAYEGNTRAAAAVLTTYEQKRGIEGNWKPEELETIAGLYLSVGQFDQASRYLYTLHQQRGLTPGTPERESTFYRIFKVLVDSGSQPVRLSRGDLSYYQEIATVDQDPGLLNGVLSLILSDQGISSEFKRKEEAAGSYFNRAFAYRIFNTYKEEFASSKNLPLMYEDLLTMFAGFGEHKIVIELGQQFQKLYPKARNYNDVTIKIADAHVALGKREQERAVLIRLLDRLAASKPKGKRLLPVTRARLSFGPAAHGTDRSDEQRQRLIEAYSDVYDPAEGNSDAQEYDPNFDNYSSSSYREQPEEKISYSSVLERIVNSYASNQKNNETLKFFWAEIKKHPEEEGLYERMLKWLGSTSLVNEQLKVYTAAVQRFQDNTWYHRLARWYIRNKQRDAFKNYSRDIVAIFDQEDINEYLKRFAAMSQRSISDINYDSQLYFELYSYAQKRFPYNLAFVRGLLKYYETNKDFKQWAALSTEYYATDRAIRDNLITYLAKTNQLRNYYQQARKAAQSSNIYTIFAADAAIALSHFEDALGTYHALVDRYPGETQYAIRLADLARSMSYNDRAAGEEAGFVYSQLARIYPTEHKFKTLAGEVYAEMSDFARAKKAWDSILTPERGKSNTYLEVASIYWDYYQYDDAIRVIKEYRQYEGNDTLLAYKLGAVYEGKGQWQQAISEYVSVLEEGDEGRAAVIKRLVQLAPRRNFAAVIEKAYKDRVAQRPENWLLAIGYSEYLRAANRDGEADTLLRQQIAEFDRGQRADAIEFLETVRGIFHRERLVADEERAIIKLGERARDEREAMKYSLQLASFYEQRKEIDKSTALFDKLVAGYPTNLGVIQEASQYYWRVGLLDKSIDLFKQSASRAQGDYRRQFILQLAKRLEAAGKLDEAEKTLRAWYAENPNDSQFFAALVSLLGQAGKQEALVELYRDGLKQAAALGGDAAIDRQIELRLAMVETLSRLNRPSEVIDQYIEIINRRPENTAMVTAAIRYAENNGQIARLTKYYEDLAKNSFKNYRWNLVLAGVYAATGEGAKEIEQYRLATVNEPQRLDLRETLADRYARAQRYDDAVTALRKNYDIDGLNPAWLTKIATVQIQAGKPEAAVATLREGFGRYAKITAAMRFEAGKLLASRGYTKQALVFYKEAMSEIQKNPLNESLGSDDLGLYSLALVKDVGAVKAYQELNAFRGAVAAAAGNGDEDTNRAASIALTVESFLKQQFARQTLDYSSPKERTDLMALLQNIVKSSNYVAQNKIREVASFANAAGLTELEEQALVKLKDNAYSSRADINSRDCYNELRTLLTFYEQRGLFVKAAETVERDMKRDRWPGDYPYHTTMAEYWRMAGDVDRELAALRAYYQAQSGNPVAGINPAIERMLNLLVEQNRLGDLAALAHQKNPHQIQLINFFIARRDQGNAIAAIDNAPFSPAWRKSRRALVELHFRNTGETVGSAFRDVLQIRTIKEMVGQKPDTDKVLFGNDWYVTASNYGVWLALNPANAKEARKYLVAKLEDKPKDAAAQLELANYYVANRSFQFAEEHLNIASELAPDSPAVAAEQGHYYFARGDRERALAAWNTIIAKRNAGVYAHTIYFNALADHGLVAQSLPSLERFLVRALTKLSWAELQPLVREVARAGSKDRAGAEATGAMFLRVMRDVPGDRNLGTMLINEDLVPLTEVRVALYRTMLDRHADFALANSEGTEYYYGLSPLQRFDSHARKFLDYLIAANELKEARAQLKYIEDLRENLLTAVNQQSKELPEWIVLARAGIDLRTGQTAAAVNALRAYARVNAAQGAAAGDGRENSSDERALKAYALLINERQFEPAYQILFDCYRQRLSAGEVSVANYSGIAGVEFKRGRGEEGLGWLRRMVAIIGDAAAAREAGAVAGRYGYFQEGLQWRELAERLDRTNIDNRIELARLAALAGRAELGVATLAKLIEDRETANSVRAQAIELLPQVVKANANLLNSTIGSYQSKSDYYSKLVLAGLLTAAGRTDEARVILIDAGTISTGAQARVMLAALEAPGNRDNLRPLLESAIYADGGESVASAVAFNTESPRRQLARLYLAGGNLRGALALDPIAGIDTAPAAEEGSEEGEAASTEESEYQMKAFSALAAAKDPQVKHQTLTDLAEERKQNSTRAILAALADAAIKKGELAQALTLLSAYRDRLTVPAEIEGVDRQRTQLNVRIDAEQAERSRLVVDSALTQSVLGTTETQRSSGL